MIRMRNFTIFTVGELLKLGYTEVGEEVELGDWGLRQRFWSNPALASYATSFHQDAACYTDTDGNEEPQKFQDSVAISCSQADVPVSKKAPEVLKASSETLPKKSKLKEK